MYRLILKILGSWIERAANAYMENKITHRVIIGTLLFVNMFYGHGLNTFTANAFSSQQAKAIGYATLTVEPSLNISGVFLNTFPKFLIDKLYDPERFNFITGDYYPSQIIKSDENNKMKINFEVSGEPNSIFQINLPTDFKIELKDPQEKNKKESDKTYLSFSEFIKDSTNGQRQDSQIITIDDSGKAKIDVEAIVKALGNKVEYSGHLIADINIQVIY